jgi:hypothetical protein
VDGVLSGSEICQELDIGKCEIRNRDAVTEGFSRAGRVPRCARFIRHDFSPRRSHRDQAFSADGGKTWETNWTTDFETVK